MYPDAGSQKQNKKKSQDAPVRLRLLCLPCAERQRLGRSSAGSMQEPPRGKRSSLSCAGHTGWWSRSPLELNLERLQAHFQPRSVQTWQSQASGFQMVKLKSHNMPRTTPQKDSCTHARVLPRATPQLVGTNRQISAMENTPYSFFPCAKPQVSTRELDHATQVWCLQLIHTAWSNSNLFPALLQQSTRIITALKRNPKY